MRASVIQTLFTFFLYIVVCFSLSFLSVVVDHSVGLPPLAITTTDPPPLSIGWLMCAKHPVNRQQLTRLVNLMKKKQKGGQWMSDTVGWWWWWWLVISFWNRVAISDFSILPNPVVVNVIGSNHQNMLPYPSSIHPICSAQLLCNKARFSCCSLVASLFLYYSQYNTLQDDSIKTWRILNPVFSQSKSLDQSFSAGQIWKRERSMCDACNLVVVVSLFYFFFLPFFLYYRYDDDDEARCRSRLYNYIIVIRLYGRWIESIPSFRDHWRWLWSSSRPSSPPTPRRL